MNFFDCAKVTIKRADDGGYMVSLACGGAGRAEPAEIVRLLAANAGY